jgi:hypothetical protein
MRESNHEEKKRALGLDILLIRSLDVGLLISTGADAQSSATNSDV